MKTTFAALLSIATVLGCGQSETESGSVRLTGLWVDGAETIAATEHGGAVAVELRVSGATGTPCWSLSHVDQSVENTDVFVEVVMQTETDVICATVIQEHELDVEVSVPAEGTYVFHFISEMGSFDLPLTVEVP